LCDSFTRNNDRTLGEKSGKQFTGITRSKAFLERYFSTIVRFYMEIFGYVLAAIGVILAAACLIALVALLLAFPVMWCWNYVIPAIFGLSVLNYWQAFCLYVLSGLLIKASQSNTNK
jgi:hypothetical protein